MCNEILSWFLGGMTTSCTGISASDPKYFTSRVPAFNPASQCRTTSWEKSPSKRNENCTETTTFSSCELISDQSSRAKISGRNLAPFSPEKLYLCWKLWRKLCTYCAFYRIKLIEILCRIMQKKVRRMKFASSFGSILQNSKWFLLEYLVTLCHYFCHYL